MGFNLILVIILSLVVLCFLVRLTVFFVKLKLEVLRFLSALRSLAWLRGIGILQSHRCDRTCLNVIMGFVTAVVVAVKVSIYSFFILFRKHRWRSFHISSVLCSLLGGVTFVTVEGFLEALNVEFGSFRVMNLVLVEVSAIVVCLLLVWMFFSHKDDKKASVFMAKNEKMPISACLGMGPCLTLLHCHYFVHV